MKTNELTGDALDWAVATAEGMSWWTRANAKWDTNDGYTDWILDEDGVLKRFYFDGSRSRAGHWEVIETFKPSTDWDQGGPIIEREGIRLHRSHTGEWWASPEVDPHRPISGATPLVAAMRCFVAEVLGDEVDIPAELM